MSIHDKGFYALMTFLVGLLIYIFLFFQPPESEAMKVCQLSHSHDVCFQALNR